MTVTYESTVELVERAAPMVDDMYRDINTVIAEHQQQGNLVATIAIVQSAAQAAAANVGLCLLRSPNRPFVEESIDVLSNEFIGHCARLFQSELRAAMEATQSQLAAEGMNVPDPLVETGRAKDGACPHCGKRHHPHIALSEGEFVDVVWSEDTGETLSVVREVDGLGWYWQIGIATDARVCVENSVSHGPFATEEEAHLDRMKHGVRIRGAWSPVHGHRQMS